MSNSNNHPNDPNFTDALNSSNTASDSNTLKLDLDASLASLLAEYLKQNTIQPLKLDPNQLAYRWVGGIKGTLQPINVNSTLRLQDLLGIETQKSKITSNTRQFLAGYPANHVLMTGTHGAGKSSLIRALLNEFKDQGLRMIEVGRDDLQMLDKIRHAITELPADTNCRYIVYCDDLAFNGQDENYRTLKSVLDGALDSEQDKLLVYATSNRRHLLPQMMKDNINIYNGQTDEVNPYETIDETVSLSDRFGLWLSFYPMDQETYLQIVAHYLTVDGFGSDSNNHIKEIEAIEWSNDLRAEALKWSSSRGGRSGRVAYQFARHWIGQHLLKTSSNDYNPE